MQGFATDIKNTWYWYDMIYMITSVRRLFLEERGCYVITAVHTNLLLLRYLAVMRKSDIIAGERCSTRKRVQVVDNTQHTPHLWDISV